MINFGTVAAGTVLYVPFQTFNAAGASVTLTGLAVTDIEIYKNGSTTQRSSDAGYTLLDTDGIDFDGITGIHGFSIDIGDNTDSGFYSAGGSFWIVVSAVTIDSQTVNFIAGVFTIEPAIGINVNVVAISGDATAADNLETMLDDTAGAVPWVGIVDQGTAQSASATGIVLRSAAAFADDTLIGAVLFAFGSTQGYWQSRIITDNALSGDAVTVDTWTVTPSGTITYKIFAGAPGSASAPSAVNVTHIAGAAVSTSTAQLGVNVVQAAGTAWGSGAITAASIAADAITAAKVADGTIDAATFAAGAINAAAIASDAITDAKVASDVTIASVTGAVGSVTGAVGSVTGNVGGNVTGSVGSVASGGITAASFAADSITAAKLAADVTTELQAGLATQASVDDLPTNAELATALGTADDAVLAQVALVKAVTDKLDGMTELGAGSPTYYRWEATSLEEAPTGGSAPSAATIADAVWDEARSGHVAGGSFGEGVASVTGAVASVTGLTASDVAAVKAKTDNLPSDPADASDVAALITAVDDLVDTEVAAIKTVVDAVKAKTDSLTFTVTGQVDSNLQYVNDTQIQGTGAVGSDEWRKV